jgi:hypothetical protein
VTVGRVVGGDVLIRRVKELEGRFIEVWRQHWHLDVVRSGTNIMETFNEVWSWIEDNTDTWEQPEALELNRFN